MRHCLTHLGLTTNCPKKLPNFQKAKKMSEELSEYELARLQRIRDNHAVLVSLGLANEEDSEDCVLLQCNSKRKRPRKEPTDEDVTSRPQPKWGLRSRGKNDLIELSDDFSAFEEAEMAEEERAELMEKKRLRAIQRGEDVEITRSGRVKRPTQHYSDIQADEIITAQDKLIAAHKKKQEQEMAVQKAMQAIQMKQMQEQSIALQAYKNANTTPLPPILFAEEPTPINYTTTDRSTYFTQGQRAVCPTCKGVFVLKQNKQMRKHICRPAQNTEPNTPSDIRPPLLPSLM